MTRYELRTYQTLKVSECSLYNVQIKLQSYRKKVDGDDKNNRNDRIMTSKLCGNLHHTLSLNAPSDGIDVGDVDVVDFDKDDSGEEV
ncbi:Hypothetical predicted protein [Octopus vulgaris]|uniref:Uncharacterized protein n=1 Tax=Octopus vulgaris TaxID=6645 RepID=A0AA36AVW4_OCTVU|nr:Hypothetical predicted protein [Octopus vulgaris]